MSDELNDIDDASGDEIEVTAKEVYEQLNQVSIFIFYFVQIYLF